MTHLSGPSQARCCQESVYIPHKDLGAERNRQESGKHQESPHFHQNTTPTGNGRPAWGTLYSVRDGGCICMTQQQGGAGGGSASCPPSQGLVGKELTRPPPP